MFPIDAVRFMQRAVSLDAGELGVPATWKGYGTMRRLDQLRWFPCLREVRMPFLRYPLED